jgi:hypothetical protein
MTNVRHGALVLASAGFFHAPVNAFSAAIYIYGTADVDFSRSIKLNE